MKATFFELGEQSLEFPKVEQRIVREGHQIASHSVSHPYFPNMSAQEQRQEIESSLSDIKKRRRCEHSHVPRTVRRVRRGMSGRTTPR